MIYLWICERHDRATIPSGVAGESKCWLCGAWSRSVRVLADATPKEMRRFVRQMTKLAAGGDGGAT